VNVIQPNCRAQFTASDLDFIVATLTEKGSPESLVKLLSDPESLDSILDDDLIYRAVLETTACLRVSTYFYFYILVRHVLRRTGIDDRNVTDYVAAMLAEFSNSNRARSPLNNQQPMDYIFDMLAALHHLDDSSQFLIRAHVGNHSLFISGVFPDHIRYRSQFRGAPEMAYYEALGSSNYRVAGDHRLAQKFDLTPIFNTLSEQFHPIRVALNDMSDRLVSLGERDPSIHLTGQG
jgi:hypothetical protein